MPHIDRTMARALVEAGYMPMSRYIECFAAEDQERVERRRARATSFARRCVPRWRLRSGHKRNVTRTKTRGVA
jgi:hypothetical protein